MSILAHLLAVNLRFKGCASPAHPIARPVAGWTPSSLRAQKRFLANNGGLRAQILSNSWIKIGAAQLSRLPAREPLRANSVQVAPLLPAPLSILSSQML